jgi:hypothetical protein
VWGIKNGDLEQVKDIVEKKVSVFCVLRHESFITTPLLTGC